MLLKPKRKMSKINNTVDLIKQVVADTASIEGSKRSNWSVSVCVSTYFNLVSEIGEVRPGGAVVKTKHGKAYVSVDEYLELGGICVQEFMRQ